MWLALLKQYWQVTLFKKSPAETPYSQFLLIVSTVLFSLFLGIQWLLAGIVEQSSLIGSLAAGFSLIASYALYTFFLLSAFHVSNRFMQTLTCLFMSHSIIHIFAFPLIVMAPWFSQGTIAAPWNLILAVLYLAFTLVLTIWQFMVSAYIYKQALSFTYLPAILASFGLLASNVLILSLWR